MLFLGNKSVCAVAGYAAFFFASVVSATEFTPKEVFSPSPVATGGAAADILGARPGMSCNEAKEVLLKTFKEEELTTQNMRLSMSHKGASISTADYLGYLSFESRAEGGYQQVSVSCTGPASGNQVVAIVRQLTLSTDVLESPSTEAATKSFEEKYGVPSGAKDRRSMGSPDAIRYWVYKDGKKFDCDASKSEPQGCRSFVQASYTPNNFDNYVQQGKGTMSILIVASVFAHRVDETKAAAFTTTIVDIARRAAAASADMESLRAEAARVHSETSKPGAMPKL